MKVKIDNLIGNTPIVKIKIKFNNKIKNIYAKLEYYNLTGSIKDRLAYYIIEESYKNGELTKGMPIIEATSGNTGISFSALGALLGHPIYIFMPDWVSQERIKIMEMYGAHVILVSIEDGGFRGAIRKADELAKKINGFRPNQFSNRLNVYAHYVTTGQEIIDKVENISAYVSGIGTGGTLIGVASKIKENYPLAQIVAMEPENMTLLSKNPKIGNHKIEGIGDDFIPDIVDKNIIDKVITISDKEAINMSKRLAMELGLGVGISSGANFLASATLEGDNIVTIFADDLKKYLTTDLSQKKDKSDYISDLIEFISIETL